jgi:hypothetical protein
MAPPVQRTTDHPFGDFSFIKNESDREMYTHDFNLINDTYGAWKVLYKHDSSKSFMFETKGDILDYIKSKMWKHHSGASASLCLRNMEFIAKQGWDDFVFLMKK